MSKFRKKPVIIDAFQWWKHGDVPEVTVIPIGKKVTEARRAKVGWLETPEGGHCVFPGDWIIINAKGQISSCNPDTFTRLYEALEQRILPFPAERGRSA